MLETYTPSKELQPYIAFFYHINWHERDYEGIINEFCLPSGHGHLAYQFKGRGLVEQKNEIQELPNFYVVGQQSVKYNIISNDTELDIYGATFKPTGLWHFFRLDMLSATDRAMLANTLLDNSSMLNFTNQFKLVQIPEKRMQIIEKLLLKTFLCIQPRLNFIDRAIQLMHETYGCCSIKKLTRQLNVSERYFQKKFKLMVGVTPCAYNRIIRFNFMFAQMKLNTPTDYQSLSVLFNYYDFPHFSKDFKKYCGACPSKFHVNKFRFLQELMIENASFVQLRESHS